MEKFILAIDQGTTGSTALLIDHAMTVHARATVDFPQHFPQPGWVEHDPEEIWASVVSATRQVLTSGGIKPTAIAAIGITNQRETTVLWQRGNGKPVHNAIVWQCRRSAAICAELKEQGLENVFRAQTGLVLDPYFSGTKLTWLLRKQPELRSAAERGELAFGTIDSFLVWRLSGGREHVTDVSNASRTLMMDLRARNWDDNLLRHLSVPRKLLPAIRSNSEVYAVTHGLDWLPDGIPVAGMAGDQQAALFGQACFNPGEAKCTYGTGAFLLENTGAEIITSHNGLLTTVAWELSGVTTYALEGSAFIAGAAVQWLRDGLGIISSSAEIETLAASVPDNGGVVFVPALTGLGAPHWNSDARGVICGLTRGATKAHLARAALEGIALQIVDLIAAMDEDRGHPLQHLNVDGGAAANDLLLQLQSDLLKRPVVRPAMVETTALGAALLAGLAVGFWRGQEEISAHWRKDRDFTPSMSAEHRDELLKQWRQALTKV